MVALADQGYDLNSCLGDWKVPKRLVLEPSVPSNVGVLVLRRMTTKNSAYSTVEPKIRAIFLAGLTLARGAAPPLPA